MQWLPMTTRSASRRSRPRSWTSTIVPASTISSCRPIVAKPSARLNVVTLTLPPLRARRQDVPLLIDHFLRDLAHRHGRGPVAVDPEPGSVAGAAN